MKRIITALLLFPLFFLLQAQTLNQKLAEQLDTCRRGDTVPTYSLYVFPNFSIPVQSDTLKEEIFLRIWNQFIVCPGDHVFSLDLGIYADRNRDSIEQEFKNLLQDNYGFSLGTRKREEVKMDYIQHSTVCFLEPEAVIKPYFIYLGDSISERSDKKLYRGGNDPETGREVIVIGGICYWFLKDGSLYTGVSLDSAGMLSFQSVQDFLNKVDTGYARWLNTRTQSNNVPLDLSRKIVDALQSDFGKTIGRVSKEEKKRRFSVADIRIYPFFPFANEEF